MFSNCFSCLGVFVSMQVYKWRHHHSDAPPGDDVDDEMSDEAKVGRFLQQARPPTAVRHSPRQTPSSSELKKRNVKLPP